MKNLMFVFLTFLCFSFSPQKESLKDIECEPTTTLDRCTDWQAWKTSGRGSQLYIKICEYESGGSGYYKFKNAYGKAVRISYEIYFKNGKSSKGSTKISGNSTTSGASCYSCASKNSGVNSWAITKIAFAGEQGYW